MTWPRADLPHFKVVCFLFIGELELSTRIADWGVYQPSSEYV